MAQQQIPQDQIEPFWGGIKDNHTEIMFKVSSAYQATFDFRDQTLATTETGKRFLRHYDTHRGELFRVARKDTRLLADCVDAYLAVFPFVKGMLAAPSKTRGKKDKETLRFSRKDHARWVGIINRFRAGSKNKKFKQVLDELEPQLRRYVGLSADEAVKTLQSSTSAKK